MADKKKKQGKPVLTKFRNFTCELYPEDLSHMSILEYIIQNFTYAFILHDKDVFDKTIIDEDTGEIKHNIGELKKPHYHVIISFKNPRDIRKLKEELELNHIESCNFYAYTRYLIHKDSPKKHQYKVDDITTNMWTRVNNALKRDYNAQEQDSRILLDFIYSRNFTTFRDLVDYAIENDCLTELKKNTYFYNLQCDNYRM